MPRKQRVTITFDAETLAYVDSLRELGPNRSRVLEELVHRFRLMKTQWDYDRWCREFYGSPETADALRSESIEELAWRSFGAMTDRLTEEEASEWSVVGSTQRGSRGRKSPGPSS